MYRVSLPARDLDAIAGDCPSTGAHWSEAATQGSSQQGQRGTKETTPGGDGEEYQREGEGAASRTKLQ